MSPVIVPPRERLAPETFTPVGGAYSHGIRVSLQRGDFVFVTGQLAIDPTSAVIGEGDVVAQAAYVINNVKRILSEADTTFTDVVDARLFMLDVQDYPRVATLLDDPIR